MKSDESQPERPAKKPKVTQGPEAEDHFVGEGALTLSTHNIKQALDHGLLINVTADRVVRLLPPLILSDAEADEIVARLAPLILAFTPDV